MPPAQTKEVIEAELDARLEDVFEWIDLEKPLGSASISQVSATHLEVLRVLAHPVQIMLHSRYTPNWQCIQVKQQQRQQTLAMLSVSSVTQDTPTCARGGARRGDACQ